MCVVQRTVYVCVTSLGVHARMETPHQLQGDIRNMDELNNAFSGVHYEAVIHFAGRKFVGESVSDPFLYYDINMRGTTNLIEVMAKHGCKNVRCRPLVAVV